MADPIPMTKRPQTEWFHGSPRKLKTLLPGSTVTPIRILARAFSHKPEVLSIEITENDDSGRRCFVITHDGTKSGFLHRVIVENPGTDLIRHPDSNGAAGEEMLTTRTLSLEFIEEVPLRSRYEYSEDLQPN
jgi:hypothetical protein